MAKRLKTEYENDFYPVKVSFVETTGTETNSIMSRPQNVEIMVINNGSLKIVSKDIEYIATAGQVLVVNADVEYQLFYEDRPAYYSVIFSPEFIFGNDDFNRLMVEKYYLGIKGTNKLDVILLDESNLRDENVLDKINDIIAVNLTHKFGYEMITKGYICNLWVLLLEYLTSGKKSYNGRNLPSQDEIRVRVAVDYIAENYADMINLEDIADKIHISRNECCRCFTRVIGISPIDYLVKRRVYEAARFIYKDPTRFGSFSELAFNVGFNSASYFNKMFKRIIGCTPSEYSYMIKNDHDSAELIYDNLENSVKVF